MYVHWTDPIGQSPDIQVIDLDTGDDLVQTHALIWVNDDCPPTWPDGHTGVYCVHAEDGHPIVPTKGDQKVSRRRYSQLLRTGRIKIVPPAVALTEPAS